MYNFKMSFLTKKKSIYNLIKLLNLYLWCKQNDANYEKKYLS